MDMCGKGRGHGEYHEVPHLILICVDMCGKGRGHGEYHEVPHLILI